MNKAELYRKEVDSLHPSEKLLSNIESIAADHKKPKKHTVKMISSIAAVFLVVILAGGMFIPALFGAKSDDRAESDTIQAQNSSAIIGTSGKYNTYSYTADENFKDSFTEEGRVVDLTSDENAAMIPADSRKLIKDAYLNVQTKDFDAFSASLDAQIKALGGYTESSEVSVSSIDGHRFGDIILRIPSDKLDSFLNAVSNSSTVTNKTLSVRDVTSTYIDTTSRIAALETEQSTLLELLKKAESLNDVLEIQGRLTQVSSDLESMKSQLNVLNEQISFSKITLSVLEVKRESSVKKEGFFSEVYSRLSDNFYSILSSARECAVWLLSSLPYFIIILIPVAIIIITVRIVRRRRLK